SSARTRDHPGLPWWRSGANLSIDSLTYLIYQPPGGIFTLSDLGAHVAQVPANQRFLDTTRGRVAALLRCEGRTVEELAQALDLTDNAVRAHLAILERDDLVRQAGVRR